jgi:hypothetical protein
MTASVLLPSEQKQLKLYENYQIADAVQIVENLDLAAIYSLFLHPLLHTFLEEIGKYFLFPIAAASNIILAILEWRAAYLTRAPRTILNASVLTLVAAALTVGVIGSLAAGLIFSTLISPIIFTAALGAKALYAGSCIYYLNEARMTVNQQHKSPFRNAALQQGIAAVAGLVATAAVACVFLFGQVALAGLGVAISLVCVGIAALYGYRLYKGKQALLKQAERNYDNYNAHSSGPEVEFNLESRSTNGMNNALSANRGDVVIDMKDLDAPVVEKAASNQGVETELKKPGLLTFSNNFANLKLPVSSVSAALFSHAPSVAPAVDIIPTNANDDYSDLPPLEEDAGSPLLNI